MLKTTRIPRLVAAIVLLMGTACGPQSDVDWIYTDGEVVLTIDVVRDGVPTLTAVGTGSDLRPEQDGCFENSMLQGSTRQRLERGVFGDLDFSQWGNAVSMCGPVTWDLGSGEKEFQLQLEYGIGNDSWFWANMWLVDEPGSMDMWSDGRNVATAESMQSGSVTNPIWLNGWGEAGASPCPAGREWCEMRAELSLSWAFSDEYIERAAW